jgi:hypothetical protein
MTTGHCGTSPATAAMRFQGTTPVRATPESAKAPGRDSSGTPTSRPLSDRTPAGIAIDKACLDPRTTKAVRSPIAPMTWSLKKSR